MIVVMQPRASEAQIQHVIDRLIELGFDVHRSTGEETTVIGALGVKKEFDKAQIEVLEGVREVVRVSQPYKLASRAFRSEGSLIDLGCGVRLGGPQVVVIAGPGAVESASQIDGIAAAVTHAGIRVLRAAVFRRRRSPRDFEAMGERGLRLLREAADHNGLRVVSEARSLTDIPTLVDFADMIQLGARNMQNDDLLDALASARKPALVERSPAATIEEFLLAADHIMAGGNYQVALCDRGIRTFESASHNALDISAIPALKRLSHLPVIVNPSGAASRRDQIAPIARAAIAAGADGLLIEVHHDPDRALVDIAHSLTIDQFEQLIGELRLIASAVGRSLA
jgi:3-deoxy-7-phosphoheptulonate synthase